MNKRLIKKSHVGFQSVFHSYQIVLCDARFVIFTLGGILLLSVEFQRTNFIAIHLAQSFIHTKWLGISFDGVKMLSLLTSINTAIIVLFTAPISRWITNRNTKKNICNGHHVIYIRLRSPSIRQHATLINFVKLHIIFW